MFLIRDLYNNVKLYINVCLKICNIYTHNPNLPKKNITWKKKKKTCLSWSASQKTMTFVGNPILCKVGLPGHVDFSSQLGMIISPTNLGFFPNKQSGGPVGTWDPSGPLKPPPRNWATRVLEVLFFFAQKSWKSSQNLCRENPAWTGTPRNHLGEDHKRNRPPTKQWEISKNKMPRRGGKDRERGWGSRG